MDYEVCVYHSDVFDEIEQGWELEQVSKPELDDDDVELFLERLTAFGYQPESSAEDNNTFVKELEGYPIRVDLYLTEITFTIPDGEDAGEVIDETLGDVVELTSGISMVIYDPQDDEWLE